MAGWHHRLDGHESEQTPGVGDGQGGLVCCDSWGRKESDMTERMNWIELMVQMGYTSNQHLWWNFQKTAEFVLRSHVISQEHNPGKTIKGHNQILKPQGPLNTFRWIWSDYRLYGIWLYFSYCIFIFGVGWSIPLSKTTKFTVVKQLLDFVF